jgi:hypothetical protein
MRASTNLLMGPDNAGRRLVVFSFGWRRTVANGSLPGSRAPLHGHRCKDEQHPEREEKAYEPQLRGHATVYAPRPHHCRRARVAGWAEAEGPPRGGCKAPGTGGPACGALALRSSSSASWWSSMIFLWKNALSQDRIAFLDACRIRSACRRCSAAWSRGSSIWIEHSREATVAARAPAESPPRHGTTGFLQCDWRPAIAVVPSPYERGLPHESCRTSRPSAKSDQQTQEVDEPRLLAVAQR